MAQHDEHVLKLNFQERFFLANHILYTARFDEYAVFKFLDIDLFKNCFLSISKCQGHFYC